MLVYAATIFLSAFLLFQVQPMIAKFILPWFGGSAAVWSASLLFFQLLLLLGYLYAHCLIRYLKPKQQIGVHFTLLLISLVTLPIIPKDYWKPVGGSDPLLGILLLLGATIGLPYFLLSSTSPLLQAWYLRTRAGVIPYRLFALSNFGSMLALLSYPFLVEPNIALRLQARIWSVGFAAFAVACGFGRLEKPRRNRPVADRRARGCPCAPLFHHPFVDLAGRLRFHSVAVHHQPPDPERGSHPAAVDRSPEHLPAELHPLV